MPPLPRNPARTLFGVLLLVLATILAVDASDPIALGWLVDVGGRATLAVWVFAGILALAGLHLIQRGIRKP